MSEFKLPDLKNWRKKYGFSQKKLAEVMKVSLATFRHLELGKGRKPQKRTLQKLAGVIAEVETKASSAEVMKAPVAMKAVAEKPEVMARQVMETKFERHAVRPVRVAETEAVRLESRISKPVEITNIDLELINRILRLNTREKLELLQKLL